MARQPHLNFDELLAPIPGDDPAGSASAYRELRPQFEEFRREVTPELASETKEDLKNADWRGLERLARDALVKTSKDLRIAGHLLEALVQVHGFEGAHDGLKLLRLLVEQCWDRLNPASDPEDAEVRAGPFNWIDDPDRGLRFPTTLRLTPLLIGPEPERKGYSLHDCRPEGNSAAAQEARRAIDRVIDASPPAHFTHILEEVTGCLEELRRLTADLSARMGPASPAMTAVRTTLEACRIYLEQVLQKRPDAGTKQDTESEDGTPGTAALAGPGASRAEIYRQVGLAATALKDLEPHSPIPYLLLRAVELGQMPFPLLMQELIRDQGTLTELKREFGIKNPPPASE